MSAHRKARVGNSEQYYCPMWMPNATNTTPKSKASPVKPTEKNREKFQHWLYYGNSTFNTYEHQPLTMMNSPPLRLVIENDAQPVACHKAIPVPIHWREPVKEGLYQDVRLGGHREGANW